MKRRDKLSSDGGGARHLAAMETDTLARYLSLVEHCALRQYDDGSKREPGYLILRTAGSAWQLVVKDPDTCTQFSVTAESLDKALETAALLLACEDAPWEPDAWALKAKKK